MAQPSVHVRTGTLVGNEHEGYLEFLGVPYAQAPIGPAAFLPPEPLPTSDEVVACHVYGATAHRRRAGAGFIPEPSIEGDNALNLNVWTPTLGDARLPVFVWIHGGGFIGGSNASPWYHGGNFARDGVVVVALNYRLGPEGYLQIGETNANRGLLDMITALGWVQENIAALGGDPDRVTIGGQSAGASACLALLTSTATAGLFRRTAVESSGGMIPSGREEAAAMARHYAAALGVSLDPAGLAAAPPERRAEVDPSYLPASSGGRPAWEGIQGPGGFGRETFTWRPSIDGSVIEADTFSRAQAGLARGDALLIGTTAEEFNGPVAQANAQLSEAEITEALRGLGVDGAGLARYLDLGRDRASLAWALGQAYTDWRFRLPAAVMADAVASSLEVFKFEFRFAARLPEPGARRAQHNSDLPFVFDNLAAERVAESIGEDPPQSLADEMHGAWVRFIEGSKEPWPRYEASAPRTMIFDAGSRLRDDVGSALTELWAAPAAAPN
jgi:para-nitrobenzyl esterase